MLRSIKEINGYKIHARDGEIGRADQILFDDQHWTVRYLVVNTGSWLKRHLVLLSPISLGPINPEMEIIYVKLTRDQIENSPDIDTNKPVSRQMEAEYNKYYGYLPYWEGASLWGGASDPSALANIGLEPHPSRAIKTIIKEESKVKPTAPKRGDPHLRSTKEVTGYYLQARDGHIGHVENFIIDDSDWAIRYLVIDTRNWWPGKKVIISPNWFGHIHWEDSTIEINLTRNEIKKAPEYHPENLINRNYENALHRYYNKKPYWKD